MPSNPLLENIRIISNQSTNLDRGDLAAFREAVERPLADTQSLRGLPGCQQQARNRLSRRTRSGQTSSLKSTHLRCFTVPGGLVADRLRYQIAEYRVSSPVLESALRCAGKRRYGRLPGITHRRLPTAGFSAVIRTLAVCPILQQQRPVSIHLVAVDPKCCRTGNDHNRVATRYIQRVLGSHGSPPFPTSALRL